MERKEFLRLLTAGVAGMSTLSAFNSFAGALGEQEHLMPVLFVGHGSPMNGIEDTEFSRTWKRMAGEIVGSSRVDLQACKLEYSIVSPK